VLVLMLVLLVLVLVLLLLASPGGQGGDQVPQEDPHPAAGGALW
jgi:hypothetical protein